MGQAGVTTPVRIGMRGDRTVNGLWARTAFYRREGSIQTEAVKRTWGSLSLLYTHDCERADPTGPGPARPGPMTILRSLYLRNRTPD